jgi:hypothetical protein
VKIFISWSGVLAQRVAELLHAFLKDMLHEVEPFMSKHDLESGTRWGQVLTQELENTTFGLICLTPDNVSQPWLLYEAGALTKHTDGRACGLLLAGLGPADVSGPLAQFQNRVFDRENVLLLMRDVNARLREPLQSDRLTRAFEKWWPDLERGVGNVIENFQTGQPTRRKRDLDEILEELLIRVREIQTTVVSQPVDVVTAAAQSNKPRERFRDVDLTILKSLRALAPAESEILNRVLESAGGIDENQIPAHILEKLQRAGLITMGLKGYVEATGMAKNAVRSINESNREG